MLSKHGLHLLVSMNFWHLKNVLPGPGFCYADGGYPADEKNVFQMGPVFTVNFANHIIREKNCIYWNHHCGLLSNNKKNYNTKKYWLSNFVILHNIHPSGWNRFHPDNKIPGLSMYGYLGVSADWFSPGKLLVQENQMGRTQILFMP